jgi:hypothetical protein
MGNGTEQSGEICRMTNTGTGASSCLLKMNGGQQIAVRDLITFHIPLSAFNQRNCLPPIRRNYPLCIIHANQQLKNKKSQKVNFTLLTESVDRIFWGNTDFLVSPVIIANRIRLKFA